MDACKKLVLVQDIKIGASRLFNVVQVKRYIAPPDVANFFFADLPRRLSRFSSPDNCDNCVLLTKLIHRTDPIRYFSGHA